jgi:uncharacterized protein (TIGR02391 family)
LGKIRLDQQLVEKLAKRLRKKPQYIREQLSRKAGRLGITSEAALVAWCQQEGMGTARFLNRQPPSVREEARNARGGAAAPAPRNGTKSARAKGHKPASSLKPVLDLLLQDQELRGRCGDLLMAKKHFDRAFREATTVLDDRVKRISTIKGLNPIALVGKALSPDPAKAVVEVSAEKDEQEGFFSISKGVMLAFRNPTHHQLSNKFTREDALKFCGFIDALLAVLNRAIVHTDRV